MINAKCEYELCTEKRGKSLASWEAAEKMIRKEEGIPGKGNKRQDPGRPGQRIQAEKLKVRSERSTVEGLEHQVGRLWNPWRFLSRILTEAGETRDWGWDRNS